MYYCITIIVFLQSFYLQASFIFVICFISSVLLLLYPLSMFSVLFLFCSFLALFFSNYLIFLTVRYTYWNRLSCSSTILSGTGSILSCCLNVSFGILSHLVSPSILLGCLIFVSFTVDRLSEKAFMIHRYTRLLSSSPSLLLMF